jgi:D-alanine-D-alanine ligase-like ATP-grasp enzyme
MIRIEAPQGSYGYHAKYFSDETKYHCPAGLPDAQETACAMAMRAYESSAAAAGADSISSCAATARFPSWK